ncbi:ABC transporter permease [Cohnella lupini]|uniref:ABC-2 type transport system permease protein n=1 Tax=Cohnella lupini TaxID=1294267 RepID=A0A3D9HZP8_9BACL|nr:ABC transporter permease [Cohnella lupini]RED54964.1 ABC-2 type transport system permease protein [Cohnella lupini]
MNVWNIMIKEIKSSLRSTQTFIFMLAFPILLMLILGTALTNAFSSTAQIGDMQLLYSNKASNPQLIQHWQGFSQAIEHEGIQIVPAADGTNGQEEIREDRYTAYVELGDDGIQVYGSSKHAIESNIIQGMLTAFANQYNLAAAAFKQDPSKAEAILANANGGSHIVRETSLDPNKQAGSMDYYAISMTTMIALYSALPGSFLFRSERTRKTAIRLMASPVSKGSLFAGKVLGSTIINFLCIIAVVLFSLFVYGANWGDHYGMVFLVLATQVIFSISLGLGLSYLLKGDSARSFIMIFTQIASFVGGAYFPVDQRGGAWITQILPYISPLHWANTALTKIIYADDLMAAWPTIGVNLGIAAAFLITAALIMRKREAL